MSNHGIVQKGRAYPFVHGNSSRVYVVDVDPMQMVHYHRVPFGLFDGGDRLLTAPVAFFASRMLDSARKQRDSNERIAALSADEPWLRDGYLAKAAEMEAILGGKVPEATSIFECYRGQILLSPSAAYLNDPELSQRDFWSYVDHLTGGCCNTRFESKDGAGLFEATTFGSEDIARIESDENVVVRAFSLEGPQEYQTTLLREMPMVMYRPYSTLPDYATAFRALREDRERGSEGTLLEDFFEEGLRARAHLRRNLLAEIESSADGLSEGPFVFDDDTMSLINGSDVIARVVSAPADGRFMAASMTAMPELMEGVRLLRGIHNAKDPSTLAEHVRQIGGVLNKLGCVRDEQPAQPVVKKSAGMSM
jgi:hypothetical protein